MQLEKDVDRAVNARVHEVMRGGGQGPLVQDVVQGGVEARAVLALPAGGGGRGPGGRLKYRGRRLCWKLGPPTSSWMRWRRVTCMILLGLGSMWLRRRRREAM